VHAETKKLKVGVWGEFFVFFIANEDEGIQGAGSHIILVT
jgi:hypothetical protein